jgi:hypothetical protein
LIYSVAPATPVQRALPGGNPEGNRRGITALEFLIAFRITSSVLHQKNKSR